ncbi:MAG: DNA repair protein RecO [Candidatus Sungiibacteriota bacterium]
MHITDALILKKEGVGEADLLITALTPDFVRVRLVAQGARKVGAKLKGHLEPLSLSRLSFVAGRNNYRLVGAELQNFFPTVKGESRRFRIASEITEILASVLFEDVAGGSNNFFILARDALMFLDEPSRTPEDCDKAFLWFRMQFLKESGLLPEGILGLGGLDGANFASCGNFAVFCDKARGVELTEAVSHLFSTYLPR